MKRPPALLPFLFALIILCLAVPLMPCAIAATKYPLTADALLYKNFTGELKRLDIEITGSVCTTRLSNLENGETAVLCQYIPTSDILFEIEYRDEAAYRFSAFIDCPTPQNPGELEYSALTAFALTFITWQEEKADDVLEELLSGLEYAEDDMWLSYINTDKAMVQYAAFDDAIYISAYLN